jgi:hypothetical protein
VFGECAEYENYFLVLDIHQILTVESVECLEIARKAFSVYEVEMMVEYKTALVVYEWGTSGMNHSASPLHPAWTERAEEIDFLLDYSPPPCPLKLGKFLDEGLLLRRPHLCLGEY